MRRALALLAVALAFAGCSMPRAERGALARAIHDGAARRVVPISGKADLAYLDLLSGMLPALGMTYRTNEMPTGVDLRLDTAMLTDPALAKNVSAHELGHVLDLSHGSCPLCWMYPTQDRGRALIDEPSEEELAAAQECLFDVDLVPDATLPPPILDALRWAAAAWNRALGRAAFTMRRTGP